MRVRTLLVWSFLATIPLSAKPYRLVIRPETPEGLLLIVIEGQADDVKRLDLLERFAELYPRHESMPWIRSEIHAVHMRAQAWDQALSSGEKAIELDPGNLEIVHGCLKAAEAKGDGSLVRRWAIRAIETARRVPQAAAGDDAAKAEADYAAQVAGRAEYLLYTQIEREPSAPDKIRLAMELERLCPNTRYLSALRHQCFLAYRETGDTARAVAIAENVVASDPVYEDMLMLVADHYFRREREPRKVIAYATRAIELLQSRPAPSHIPEGEWKKGKNLTLGLAYWLAGVTYNKENRLLESDRYLRAALPYLQSQPNLLAEALVRLGYANLEIAEAAGDRRRMEDAAKFNKQAIEIESPFQAQAKRNFEVVQAKLGH